MNILTPKIERGEEIERGQQVIILVIRSPNMHSLHIRSSLTHAASGPFKLLRTHVGRVREIGPARIIIDGQSHTTKLAYSLPIPG
jgi:hypothetical protein